MEAEGPAGAGAHIGIRLDGAARRGMMEPRLHRRGLRALVLGALLARVVFPAFHFHEEERGHGGECRHEAQGPAVAAAEPECAVCELLATKAPGLVSEPPPHVAPLRLATGERARDAVAAPRCAFFWVVCGPRGPPASSPA